MGQTLFQSCQDFQHEIRKPELLKKIKEEASPADKIVIEKKCEALSDATLTAVSSTHQTRSVIDIQIQSFFQTYLLDVKDAHLGAQIILKLVRDGREWNFVFLSQVESMWEKELMCSNSEYWVINGTITDATISPKADALRVCIWRTCANPEKLRIIVKPCMRS